MSCHAGSTSVKPSRNSEVAPLHASAGLATTVTAKTALIIRAPLTYLNTIWILLVLTWAASARDLSVIPLRCQYDAVKLTAGKTFSNIELTAPEFISASAWQGL